MLFYDFQIYLNPLTQFTMHPSSQILLKKKRFLAILIYSRKLSKAVGALAVVIL